MGIHPAVVCLKWAIQRGQTPIPFSTNRRNYLSSIQGVVSAPLIKVSGQDRVLIAGMGPVGMAAGLVAKKIGATQVIGADVSQARLDFALEVGAIDQAVRADSPEAVAQIKGLTGQEGCEVSID